MEKTLERVSSVYTNSETGIGLKGEPRRYSHR